MTILTEMRDRVLLITLNRPERLNAWTPQMGADLAAAIAAANDSPDVGAVVLTGAGRGFCAGADMEDTFSKRLGGEDPGEDTAGGQGGMPASVDWVSLCMGSKPLIAAVNGVAVGVGLTQVLCFDVIVASNTARFGMGFIKVGLVPELASTRLIVQRMGPGRARSFALSGDLWPAQQAYDFGLVDHLAEPESVVDDALALAGRMAANPAPQLVWTKQLLAANAVDPDFDAIQKRETALLVKCWASPEHAEAVAAFAARQRPGQ